MTTINGRFKITEAKTLFSNVNVFDGTSEKRLENANVLIEGNLIKEVTTSRIQRREQR